MGRLAHILVDSTGYCTKLPKILDCLEFFPKASTLNSDFLRNLYETKRRSTRQIADLLGVSRSHVSALLSDFGIVKGRTQKRLKDNYSPQQCAPFGWHVVGRKLIENRQEAKVVKLAQKLKAQGLGARAIARELNAKGHLNRAGKPFIHGSVQQMLRHPLNQTL